MMYTVRGLLLCVLFGSYANGFPHGSDIVINFNGNTNQLKIEKINAPSRDYLLFEKSYYKYHRGPQVWSKARQICELEGGYLAIINSEDEANFLTGLMNKYPNEALNDVVHKSYVHIGFHGYFKEGEYSTIDGKSLESSGYMHWAPGQPDNIAHEKCGSLYREGGLNDLSCDSTTPFICEISAENLCSFSQPEKQDLKPIFDVRMS